MEKPSQRKTRVVRTVENPTPLDMVKGRLNKSIYSAMIANELDRLERYQCEAPELNPAWKHHYDKVSELHSAAFHGDLDTVKQLHKEGHKINALTTDGPKLLKQLNNPGEQYGKNLSGFFLGTTPLMMASQQGHLEVVRYLVDHCRVKVNATDTLGMSALAMACAFNHILVAKHLLLRGAHPNLPETHLGMTPLILACANNNADTVKLLVEHNVDVKARDDEGRTGIHYAAWNYNADLVDFLHYNDDREMTINAQDNDGNTPLHLLVSDLDLEAGGELYNILNTTGGQDVVKAINKQKGVFLDILSDNTRGSHVPGEEYLCLVHMIKLGARYTLRNRLGRTVLHTLCARLVPAKEIDGFIHTASPTQNQTLLVMLRILLKLHSKPDEKDYHGHTSIDLCSKQKNWVAQRMLDSHGYHAHHHHTANTHCYGYKYGPGTAIRWSVLEQDIETIALSALQHKRKEKWRRLVARLMSQ